MDILEIIGFVLAVLAFMGIFTYKDVPKVVKRQSPATPPAPIESPPPVVAAQFIPADDDRFHINDVHLPLPTTTQLIGRKSELAELGKALRSTKIGVVAWIAGGGTGKSTLTYHWLQHLKDKGFGDIKRVFGFSFYSQGHHKTYNDSSAFFAQVLPFLGVADMPTDEIEKGRALAGCLARQAVLLILDGLEPLQLDTVAHDGRLQDVALQAFFTALRGRRHPRSMVLVSSRQELKELAQWEKSAYLQNNLNNLSAADGAALLRGQGVKGSEEDLREVASGVNGHALSLALLSKLVVTECEGVIPAEWKSLWSASRRLHNAQDVQATACTPTSDDRHAFRILAWYQDTLDDSARWFMYALGLFDRPLGWREWAVLLQEVAAFAPLRDLNKSTKAWREFESRLERLGLLADDSRSHAARGSERAARTTWDTHALIRAFFAQQFAAQQPAAFQAAHRALFVWYQRQAPDLPDNLTEMQALYRAVVHGCLAGDFQAALDDVYFRRITRGEGFSVKKLGAYAQDLSAIAAFFPAGWHTPPAHTGLSDADQAWLLAAAAFRLMALGRLREALLPRAASLELLIKAKKWKFASVAAQNLVDLHLPLGELADAAAQAQQAIEFAERAGGKFYQMTSHASLATVLHRQGRLDEAARFFARAEEIQRERDTGNPQLNSLPGAWYCALLLDLSSDVGSDVGRIKRSVSANSAPSSVGGYGANGRALIRPTVATVEVATEVLQRGEYGLKIAREPLSIAFNKLTLARAHAALQQQPPDQLKQHFDQAVTAIEASKSVLDFPPFYLARAAFLLDNHDLAAAKADVDSARDIIQRGDMALYAVDADLLEAHYWAAQGEPSKAAYFQECAEMGIEKTGYGLRRLVAVS